jgi:hypothetical protein
MMYLMLESFIYPILVTLIYIFDKKGSFGYILFQFSLVCRIYAGDQALQ